MHLFSTPAITETSSSHSSGSAQNLPSSTPIGTPQMSLLFNDISNIKVGYFGKLEFLDIQAAFAEVFGDKPTILAPNRTTSQDFTSEARILYSYGEKCKLVVFLHMYRN